MADVEQDERPPEPSIAAAANGIEPTYARAIARELTRSATPNMADIVGASAIGDAVRAMALLQTQQVKQGLQIADIVRMSGISETVRAMGEIQARQITDALRGMEVMSTAAATVRQLMGDSIAQHQAATLRQALAGATKGLEIHQRQTARFVSDVMRTITEDADLRRQHLALLRVALTGVPTPDTAAKPRRITIRPMSVKDYPVLYLTLMPFLLPHLDSQNPRALLHAHILTICFMVTLALALEALRNDD